jgi:hypothetical protein
MKTKLINEEENIQTTTGNSSNTENCPAANGTDDHINPNENSNINPMEENSIDDMLVGRIYKNQLSQTRDDIDKIIAHKINKRIETAKEEFIQGLKSAKGK